MKIYTIANETRECYGHGDYGSELKICRHGPYGTGGFPPAFTTREAAEVYLNGLEVRFGKIVVELDLRETA